MKRKIKLIKYIFMVLGIVVIVAPLSILSWVSLANAKQPDMEILAGKISIPMDDDNNFSLSLSKVLIGAPKDTQRITVILNNESNQTMTLNIYERKANYLETGYVEIDSSSDFKVYVLTDSVTLQPQESVPVDILVVRVNKHAKIDTEAWYGVKSVSNDSIQRELCLRILIKAK